MKKVLSLFLIIGTILVLTACGSSAYIDNSKFINITDADNNLSEVKEDEYLVYYYAVSCVHCANFKSTLKEYLDKEDALNIYAYNLDNDGLHESAKEVAEKFGIAVEGTPTLAYVKDGVLVDVVVGVQELDEIFVKGSYEKYDLVEENKGEIKETEVESTENETTDNN